jgi:threonine aldolase
MAAPAPIDDPHALTREFAVDLRTDFISRPTPAMIDAMVRAAQTPPGFGLRDDPFVAALERRAADILGKEDALFCPTCTAANQIAINLSTVPGDRVVADATAHIITSEGGAPGALSGVMMQGLASHRGEMPLDALLAALDGGDSVQGRTRLAVIENTHVRSGGTVLPLDYMKRVRQETAARGILLHLDGSRLFNAAAALGVNVNALSALADTVAVSLNKGLGAPLGAILAGSREAIEKAVTVRHRWGGSWRPANIPAAAALVALDTMIDRIGEDHRNARDLATRLAALDSLSVDLTQVQTNIVLVDLAESLGIAEAFAAHLSERGVLALPFGPRRLRLVAWHEIGAAEIDRAVAAFGQAIETPGKHGRHP